MNYKKMIKFNYSLINLYEASKDIFPLQASDYSYKQKVLFEEIKDLVKEYKKIQKNKSTISKKKPFIKSNKSFFIQDDNNGFDNYEIEDKQDYDYDYQIQYEQAQK